MTLTGLQQRLLNDFQRDFPLSPTPYADMADRLGVSEARVLAMLKQLRDGRYISRVGAVFSPNSVGASQLAAMAVPPERLDSVAEWISAMPEVNHNYEREHHYNLWFVLTASDEATLAQVTATIEHHCGLPVLSLPLLEEFRIDLGFEMNFEAAGS